MNRLLVFLLSVLWVMNAWTKETSWHGRMIDESGVAVAGVTAEWYVNGERKMAAADKKGELTLSGIYATKGQIVFYAPGYCPVVLGSGELTGLRDVVLVQDRLLLHSVQVTATRTPHTVGTTPVPGRVVSREEFSSRGVTSSSDILEELEGVTLTREAGSWGNQGNISLCGLPSEHTLILVDGQQYRGGHNGVDVSSIPVELVEQVEVVKGPGSALYGSDAIGGVVQFITRPVLNSSSFFSGKLSYGGNEQYGADMSGRLSRKNWGLFAGASQNGGEGVDSKNDTHRNQTLFAKGGVKFADSLRMNFNSRYEFLRLEDQFRDQRRLSLNQSTEWSREGHSFTLRTAFFNYDHQTDDRSSDWVTRIYELELASTHSLWERNVLSAGVSSQWETVDDPGKGYKADQGIRSAFAQDELLLGPLTVLMGLRADHHKKWGTEINPRLGFSWNFLKDVKLRFSTGRAFKAPQLSELHGSWAMGPYFVKPNPNLQPETSWGYQTGVDWQPSGVFRFTVNAFLNEIHNQVVAVYSRRTRPWGLSWINLGRSRTQGVEGEGRYSPNSSLSFSGGFSLLKTEDLDAGTSLLYQPSWTGRLVADWKTGIVDVHALVRATGKRWIESSSGSNSSTEHLPAFVTADLAFSRSLGDTLQVYLKLANLFGKESIPDEYNLDGMKVYAGIGFRLD